MVREFQTATQIDKPLFSKSFFILTRGFVFSIKLSMSKFALGKDNFIEKSFALILANEIC